MKIIRKSVSVLLMLVMILALCPAAAMAATVNDASSDTAAYLQKTVADPQVGSTGGEWAVIGLARWDGSVPDAYFDKYYTNVEKYVQDKKGILDSRKYTEYSRVVMALTAIGKDPSNVAGYNLLEPLGDFESVIWQGINGPVFALIALDAGKYDMPQNSSASTQATRDLYIQEILSRQLNDGGFSLTGGKTEETKSDPADPDITGMVLQALSKYQDRADVKKATEGALTCLSTIQDSKGGFSSWGSANSESVVQVITALCELGISIDDSRFVKNGNTLVDNLLIYYNQGKGFAHVLDGSGDDLMATEQGLYALVAVQRAQTSGKNSLYNMTDVAVTPINNPGNEQGSETGSGTGFSGREADIKVPAVTKAGTTFSDIAGHANQNAIEKLAERSIINGRSDSVFAPNETMTRAEFATIVVQALGLGEKNVSVFTDVSSSSWYTGYVGAAYDYGIVSGTSASSFNPQGTITRQDAASMVARAAALCGMDTSMDTTAVRDMLSQFNDYTQSADWAQESLAFCYDEDILSQSDLSIEPTRAIQRCEIAEMVYRLLGSAELI